MRPMSDLKELLKGGGIVFRHEFNSTVRRVSFVIITLTPIVLAAVALTIFGVFRLATDSEDGDVADADVEPRMAGYVDRTGESGEPLFTGFHEQFGVTFVPIADTAVGVAAMADGDIDTLFVFSPTFLKTGAVNQIDLAAENLAESIGFDDYSYASELRRFVVANLFSDNVRQDRATRLTVPFVLSTHEVESDGTPSSGPDASDFGRALFYAAGGIALLMTIFMSSGYLLNALSEEKENRVMEVLLSSVKPEALLVGKFAGLGVAALLQMTIWIISIGLALFAFSLIVDLPGGLVAVPAAIDIIIVAAYFVIGYFFFASLTASIGAATTTLREANQASALITVPAFAPLWFLGVILPNPDGTLAKVFSYIPVTAPVAAMFRRALDAMSIWEVVLALAILATLSMLGMLLAVRLFRAYLLMYGQRPSIAQIARTVIRG